MMANLMNIATNTQACLVEKMYGRNIMSSFHGLWSLGGFSGGIIGAVFANTLLPIEAHFGAVLSMSLLIITIGFRYLVDDATAKAEEEDVPKFSFKTIDPILFLLGLMGFAGMFCEGTVYDWSGVYFSSVVKPDEAFIRAGYVAGMGAMTLGRFLADGFVTKYGPVKDMLVDGVIGGVGAVIVFLPQILILYFFISYMEDSGYMARAAFIMDKLMHKMGLHGKIGNKDLKQKNDE